MIGIKKDNKVVYRLVLARVHKAIVSANQNNSLSSFGPTSSPVQKMQMMGPLKVACVVVPLVAMMGMSGLTGEPAQLSDHPRTDKGGFIDEHVHFDDRHAGDLDKVAEWMKSNNVQRCINHPLAQIRTRNEDERKQMLENYAKYKGRIDRFCIIFPDEVNSVEEAVKILTKEKQDGAIGFGEHYGVGLKFDDPKNLRLYEACQKVGCR